MRRRIARKTGMRQTKQNPDIRSPGNNSTFQFSADGTVKAVNVNSSQFFLKMEQFQEMEQFHFTAL